MTDTAMTREALLTRYRTIRQTIAQHLNAAVKCASGKAIRDTARRIGLMTGGVMVSDNFGEMTLVFDLILFGTKADRSRAIDRYARASRFPAGSTEAAVLDAMRASTFHIVQLKRRHEIAGVVVGDLYRTEEMWLMDEGFEATMTNGLAIATRLTRVDDYYCTAGVSVPLDRAVLLDALGTLSARHRPFGPETLGDPRLPEAIYAAAVRNGAMNAIEFGGAE